VELVFVSGKTLLFPIFSASRALRDPVFLINRSRAITGSPDFFLPVMALRFSDSRNPQSSAIRFFGFPINRSRAITGSPGLFRAPPRHFSFLLQTKALPQFDASVTLAWPLGDAWVALAWPKGHPIPDPSRQRVATHKAQNATESSVAPRCDFANTNY
jgi:hypothetical protein